MTVNLVLLFLAIAAVLTAYELTVRSNYRAPIVWAVLFVIVALFLARLPG